MFSFAIRDFELLKGMFYKADYGNPLLKYTYLMLAEAYIAIGNYTNASIVYKELIGIDKKSGLSYFNLSVISYHFGKFPDFFFYLDLAKYYGIDSYVKFIDYFQEEYEKGLFASSDSFLIGDYYVNRNELVNKASDYYYLASVYRKIDKLDKALEIYENILESLTNVKGVHCAMGEIYEVKKDYVKAKEHYLEELDENPIYYNALLGLRRINYVLFDKEIEKRIEDFDGILESKKIKEISYDKMFKQDDTPNDKKSISSVYFDCEIVEDGNYSFMIVVSGKKALEAYPLMSMFVDGALVSKFYVDSEENNFCLANDVLKKGSHRIKISFDNDYYDSSINQDRNLYLSKVVIYE